MVFWCKNCGALIGLREPRTDWSTDRSRNCQICLEKIALIAGFETSHTDFIKPVDSHESPESGLNESVHS